MRLLKESKTKKLKLKIARGEMSPKRMIKIQYRKGSTKTPKFRKRKAVKFEYPNPAPLPTMPDQQ